MNKCRRAIRDNTLSKKVGITIVGRQHRTDIWAVSSDKFIDGITGMYLLNVKQPNHIIIDCVFYAVVYHTV